MATARVWKWRESGRIRFTAFNCAFTVFCMPFACFYNILDLLAVFRHFPQQRSAVTNFPTAAGYISGTKHSLKLQKFKTYLNKIRTRPKHGVSQKVDKAMLPSGLTFRSRARTYVPLGGDEVCNGTVNPGEEANTKCPGNLEWEAFCLNNKAPWSPYDTISAIP